MIVPSLPPSQLVLETTTISLPAALEAAATLKERNSKCEKLLDY